VIRSDSSTVTITWEPPESPRWRRMAAGIGMRPDFSSRGAPVLLRAGHRRRPPTHRDAWRFLHRPPGAGLTASTSSRSKPRRRSAPGRGWWAQSRRTTLAADSSSPCPAGPCRTFRCPRNRRSGRPGRNGRERRVGREKRVSLNCATSGLAVRPATRLGFSGTNSCHSHGGLSEMKVP